MRNNPAVAVLLLFLAMHESIAQDQAPSAEALESQALEDRRKHLQSGHVVLFSTQTSARPDGQNSEFEYDITFDKDRIRFDVKSRLLGSETWSDPQRFVLTKDRYIEDTKRSLVVNIGRRSADSPDRRPLGFPVFHPRTLGMTVNGTAGMIHEGIESVLGRVDRSEPSVRKGELDALDTWRIDYRHNAGAEFSIWISPSKGNGVVRAESRKSLPQGQIVQSVSNELIQYRPSNTWYPRRSEHELSLNGKWQKREVIIVQKASFGNTVDSQRFLLAGMDLLPGRIVSDNSDVVPVGQVWNGKDLLPLITNDVKRGESSMGRLSHSWLFIVNAILFAALAFFFILRAMRSRRC